MGDSMRSVVILCAALLALAGSSGIRGVAEASARPAQGAVEGGTVPPVALELVKAGLERPVYLTHAGDGSGRLFVVEKFGRIRIIQNGDLLTVPFLDISSRVESGGNEQGLLSVAFHPNYATNGRFFVYYTTQAVGNVPDGTLVIAEYQVSAGDPNRASATEKVLLTIDHPAQQNHNGGLLKFGPDGFLYAGIGDGGGAGDPGPPPGNGQNTGVLLGKILRIDVNSGSPYGIPSGNPFANGANGRREIYAYGLRNPWRWSFDRVTGDLWVADVGQNTFEEVDIVTNGGNFGWNRMEGFHCFNPPAGCDMNGLVQPIFEYSHGGSNGVPSGCSITGGYLYRGTAIPSLIGTYVFADYCLGAGSLLAIHRGDSSATIIPTGVTGEPVNSFGEDQDGELYVVTDSVFGGHGRIYKLVRSGNGCDIGCPGDVTVETPEGTDSAVVTYDAPQTAGDCGVVACTPSSGSSFAVGTTTVTCSSAGATASCSFTVGVQVASAHSITGLDPDSLPRKARMTVSIQGSGFAAGAVVSFGKKIKVRSVTVASPTEIRADIKVKKAKRGARGVTVTNPDGSMASCEACFTVQ